MAAGSGTNLAAVQFMRCTSIAFLVALLAALLGRVGFSRAQAPAASPASVASPGHLPAVPSAGAAAMTPGATTATGGATVGARLPVGGFAASMGAAPPASAPPTTSTTNTTTANGQANTNGLVPTPVPTTAQQAAQVVGIAQSRLNQGGYYHGPIDGVLDEATRRSVRAYQQDVGLPPTGELDAQTLAILSADSFAIAGQSAFSPSSFNLATPRTSRTPAPASSVPFPLSSQTQPGATVPFPLSTPSPAAPLPQSPLFIQP